MREFEKTLYEAMLVAYGKILSKYNVFAQGSILRDVGKEMIDYLDSHGFGIHATGTVGDLSAMIQLFVQNGFAERLEIEPADQGLKYIWHKLYGVDAYRELHEMSDNPFLACPLNVCLFYLTEKLNKTMLLHKKSFDLEAGTVEAQYELVDKEPSLEEERGFNALILENARLYELAFERSEQLQKALDEIKALKNIVSVVHPNRKKRDLKDASSVQASVEKPKDGEAQSRHGEIRKRSCRKNRFKDIRGIQEYKQI